jgi:hypothetical protein
MDSVPEAGTVGEREGFGAAASMAEESVGTSSFQAMTSIGFSRCVCVTQRRFNDGQRDKAETASNCSSKHILSNPAIGEREEAEGNVEAAAAAGLDLLG